MSDIHSGKTKPHSRAIIMAWNMKRCADPTLQIPWNKTSIYRACEQCRKLCRLPPTRLKRFRFCSAACRHIWQRSITGLAHPLWKEKRNQTCLSCEAVFEVRAASQRQFCSRQCVGTYTCRKQQGRRSSIETAIDLVLTALNVTHISQAQLGPWTVDFLIPVERLVIECDGTYWHALPKRVVLERCVVV